MKHSKSQRGAAIIEAVIVLLTMALLVAGSWYVWHRSKRTNEASKQNSTKSQTIGDSNNRPNETPKQVDPSEDGKYLVIKEWGVRFEVPEAVRGDVAYGMFTFKNGEQATYFASKKLIAKNPGGACDLTPEVDSTGQGVAGGTVSIHRSKTKPKEIDQRSFSFLEYWYTLDFTNGGACYEGDTGQEKSRFNVLIDHAIRQLENIPS